jgi:hypothetical protein
MPLTLTILRDFLKSTQVGIAVAEARVKFWELCESLVYYIGLEKSSYVIKVSVSVLFYTHCLFPY